MPSGAGRSDLFGWLAIASVDVGLSSLRVVLWFDVVGRECSGLLVLFEVLLQVRDAPATAGSCAGTLADLTGNSRPVNPQVAENFPLFDVEAVADCII